MSPDCVAECVHDYNKAMRRAEKGKYKARPHAGHGEELEAR